MEIYKKLSKVQSELKAPKGNYNSFGKYKYRSCEDIVEAVKPLLSENGLTMIICDSIEVVGDRYYVKALVKLIDIETGDIIEAQAFAREEESKKGADGSQVTGASSSYARKYALNGLLCIDDTKDADATNDHGQQAAAEQKKISTDKVTVIVNLLGETGTNVDEFLKYFKVTDVSQMNEMQFKKAVALLEKKKEV